MKRLLLLLAMFTLMGCTMEPEGSLESEAHMQQPSSSLDSPSPVPLVPLGEVPKVAAIIVTGQDGEYRYTPGSESDTLQLAGPLRLSIEVVNSNAQGLAEWYFEGLFNPEPGRIPADAKQVIFLGNNHEIEWNPGPGTQGKLWVVVWGNNSPEGRIGWRSWDLYPMYPLGETSVCPPITLTIPSRDEQNAADLGQTSVNRQMNQLIIDRMGDRFLIPLSADPATCTDPVIAAKLRIAQGR